MNSKPIPLSFARCLLRLSKGEILKASEIKAKSFLKPFTDDGIIQKLPVAGRRVTYACSDPQSLRVYLEVQHGILSLENYLASFESASMDGEGSLAASKSTKTFRSQSLQGFFIKAFNSGLKIGNQPVSPAPEGIELFVWRPDLLQVSPEALIVGIENPECFLKFDRLIKLFPQKEIVVVMRYLSHSSNRWLQTIPNNYLHFGDFDPAGLSIYIREFRDLLPAHRCRFFIPPDIEKLICEYGIEALYDQQAHLLDSIDLHLYPEIEQLAQLLSAYRKGLEQERLLSVFHL
ncbi:hypothetical protein [Mangrovibacterium marinum]|uniref:DUF7281 domain-containing protein n=1 Tax=Mangrovibacterium marinum TaxID=1639118 RepID=A0A2T5C3G9_9BACT|nr:hypothetical protein [Mangrovibacterium marinum]PTN09286.1 hypothetical protein C8N47_105127 [Mangrovibacterium marinum]